jgi:hypothetical protein
MRNKVTCAERYKRDMETELSVLDPDTQPMVPPSDRSIFTIEEEAGESKA